MYLVLLILLILLLVGVIPTWPHSAAWGYGPSGAVGADCGGGAGVVPDGADLRPAREHAQTHEVWTRQSERAWLLTLTSGSNSRGYLVGLGQRRVAFDGKPVTAQFLEDCRLDHQRAVDRGAESAHGPAAGARDAGVAARLHAAARIRSRSGRRCRAGLSLCAAWSGIGGRARTRRRSTGCSVRAMQRTGTYYYVFPTFQQGRRVLWDGITDGQPFLRHVPEALITSRNETDMKHHARERQRVSDHRLAIATTTCAARTRWAWCSASTGSNIRARGKWWPRSSARTEGWAVFAYTPIGGIDNIGAKLYQMASQNPAWFCQRLTIDDTDGVFTAEDLAEERAAGMDEDRIQQEYYCAFQGVATGGVLPEGTPARARGGPAGPVPVRPEVSRRDGVGPGHEGRDGDLVLPAGRAAGAC